MRSNSTSARSTWMFRPDIWGDWKCTFAQFFHMKMWHDQHLIRLWLVRHMQCDQWPSPGGESGVVHLHDAPVCRSQRNFTEVTLHIPEANQVSPTNASC